MKKYAIMVMSCAAVLLSSCGTRILMTEAVPARVNLGRDTCMWVISSNEQMRQSFANKIASDGYYRLPSMGNINAYADLRIRDINKITGENTANASLTATAEVLTGQQKVYSKRYKVNIKCRDGYYLTGDAYDTYARWVMEDLTPHEEGYYVRVKGSSKNPAVKKAALCMRAGDWKQGAQYAMEAVNNDPQDPEAYYVCGLAKRHDMEYGKSTEYFEKAFSLKPKGKYKAAIYKNRQLLTNDAYVRKQLAGE